MKYAFISYSSREQSVADSMRNVLIQNEIETWMAPYNIPVGGKYSASITSAIKNCYCVILILSNISQNSEHVSREIDLAIKYKKNIIPIKIEKFDLNSEFEYYLSNVQFISVENFTEHEKKYVINVIKEIMNDTSVSQLSTQKDNHISNDNRFSIITGKEVTHEDIEQAVELDSLLYDDVYHVDTSQCDEWFAVNPDIYVMAKDLKSNRIIAYINVSPITDECYDRIKNGDFIDTGITADMILSYDMPFVYSIYFSSIAIHPDYRNTEVFSLLMNAIVDKFINLGNRGIFIRRMIADAVSQSGEKFCKMFGMSKIVGSDHDSTLYEIAMIPPKFRIISKKTRDLCDLYQKVYDEESYLFEE